MSKLLELAELAENLLCEWAAIEAFNQAVHDTIDGIKTVIPPDYCRSLDAAMTLVPEGWRLAALCEREPWFVRLETLDFKDITWGKGSEWLTDILAGQETMVNAATPALALCAAALRARASIEGGEK